MLKFLPFCVLYCFDSDTFGAAAGASVREEIVDVKANLSDLNEQQIKLLAQIKDCCNKTQLAVS